MQMEQVGFSENGFTLTKDFILANKVVVTDFFGDNRETWYKKLREGGATFSGTALESQDPFDEDIENDEDEKKDLPPLDPERITEGRAENISKFFEENKDAAQAFLEYSKVAK